MFKLSLDMSEGDFLNGAPRLSGPLSALLA